MMETRVCSHISRDPTFTLKYHSPLISSIHLRMGEYPLYKNVQLRRYEVGRKGY
jgi:hypothetical protein